MGTQVGRDLPDGHRGYPVVAVVASSSRSGGGGGVRSDREDERDK